MSSPEEDNTAPSSKRRKYPRACDYCRRKKIKCDGPQMPNHRCSKCIYKKIDCTYVEPLHKHFYPASHVEALESRCQKLEQLLVRLKPDVDLAEELDEQGGLHAPVSDSSRNQLVGATSGAFSLAVASLQEQIDYESGEDESELLKVNLTDEFGKISIAEKPASYLYHGKSSSMVLLRAVKDLSDTCAEDKVPSVLNLPQSSTSKFAPSVNIPWLCGTSSDRIHPFRDFPPPDLMHTLIDLYFTHVNDYSPVLHEPTFRQGVSQGLYHSAGGFGATLLLVCAAGSRFSRDPRTLQGADDATSPGWKWFKQVDGVYSSVVASPDLHNLQIRVLMAMYLQGTTVPYVCWAHVGAGIRTGIEMGAHRKKTYGDEPSAEAELLKRTFWILVTLDWGLAYALGRPSCIHDEDMDLPYPLECDDEYWTDVNGKPVFQQPAGKPSKISYFVSYIRLIQVLASAVRTVYAINKSKVQLRHGDQQWEKRIVAELDSALNNWVDAVPDHLRWDPHREDSLFFKQSATLLSHYYLFRIAVHRPFVEKRKESPLSFTSIVICMNAAKSSIRLLEQTYRRLGTPMHKNAATLFMAAMAMVLHILSEKSCGRTDNLGPYVQDVQKCMNMLLVVEHEVPTAKRLVGILSLFGLTSPPDPTMTATSAQSDFGNDQSSGSSPPDSMDQPPSMESTRGYATYSSQSQSMGVSAYDPSHQHHVSERTSFDAASLMTANDATDPSSSFVLPLHTQELIQMYPAMYGAAPLPVPAEGLQGSQLPPLEASYETAHYAVHQGLVPDLHHMSQHADNGMQFFEASGLEPLGYNQPLLPTYPGVLGPSAYQTQYAPHGAVPQQVGADYLAMEDALSTWSNAPSFYGWDDWGPFLSNVGQHGRPSG